MSTPTTGPEDSAITRAANAVVAAVDAIEEVVLRDDDGLGATVTVVHGVSDQVRSSLDSLRDLAMVVVDGVRASEADRADLRTKVTTAQQTATSAGTTASAAQQTASTAASTASSISSTASAASSAASSAKSTADAAKATADAAKTTADAAKVTADKAASDLAALAARRSRSAPAVAVPAMLSLLGGAASVDVVVTWATPWPDNTYTTVPVLEPSAALAGRQVAIVKSQTAASATITVTTSAVLAAGTCNLRAVSVA